MFCIGGGVGGRDGVGGETLSTRLTVTCNQYSEPDPPTPARLFVMMVSRGQLSPLASHQLIIVNILFKLPAISGISSSLRNKMMDCTTELYSVILAGILALTVW